jgi:hypothetical protein
MPPNSSGYGLNRFGLMIPEATMPAVAANVETGTDNIGYTGGWAGYDGAGFGFGGGAVSSGGLYGPGTRMSSFGEMLPDPRWATPYDLDQMVRVDGKIAAVYAALTTPIRTAKNSTTAGHGDTGEADWCKQWIAALSGTTPMELVVGQLTGGRLYGRAMFEIKLQVTPDGRMTPVKIAWRPPHNTIISRDADDNVNGLLQRLPGASDPIPIPLDRALIYLNSPHIDPRNGVSDLLAAWCVHRLKMAILNLWSVFLRRTATPWANAHVAAQDLGRATALARRVATLKSGGVVGTAGDETVTMLDASGHGSANFEAAMTWCDQQISGSALAQFLELGQSKVGSFALSQDHSDFFTMAQEAVAGEIAAAVSTMLARIVALNFASGVPPTFSFGPLSDATSTELVAVFTAIMAAPSPPPGVTGAFLSSLIGQVAGALGLDTVAIEAESQTPAANALASGVEHAARLAQAAGVA